MASLKGLTEFSHILTQLLQEIGVDSKGEGRVPGGCLVIAKSHLDQQLDRALEQQAREGGIVLPVVVERHAIRIGPLLSVAGGPCLLCVRRRRGQHDHNLSNEVGPTNDDEFDMNLLRATAAIVAGYICRDFAGRSLTVLSRLDGDIRVHRVVPCDDCPKCAMPNTGPVASTTSGLEVAT